MTSLRTRFIGMAAGAAAVAFAGQAFALDEVSFGTNWLAQAEHGGFYQAVADGTLTTDNVDEYVDGIHFEHSQMFGNEAPSRQDWYDYAYHHLEGDMRNT